MSDISQIFRILSAPLGMSTIDFAIWCVVAVVLIVGGIRFRIATFVIIGIVIATILTMGWYPPLAVGFLIAALILGLLYLLSAGVRNLVFRLNAWTRTHSGVSLFISLTAGGVFGCFLGFLLKSANFIR